MADRRYLRTASRAVVVSGDTKAHRFTGSIPDDLGHRAEDGVMDTEQQDDNTTSPADIDRGGSLSGIRAALERNPVGSVHWATLTPDSRITPSAKEC